MIKNNENGFTGKEFMMVIVVIAVLCLAAIPQFYSMQKSKREADLAKLVTLVEEGLRKKQSDDPLLTFPAELDGAEVGKPCENCFSTALEKPLKSSLWFKAAPLEYYYSLDGDSGSTDSYKEVGDYHVTYNPKTGRVIATPILP